MSDVRRGSPQFICVWLVAGLPRAGAAQVRSTLPACENEVPAHLMVDVVGRAVFTKVTKLAILRESCSAPRPFFASSKLLEFRTPPPCSAAVLRRDD